MEDCSAEAPVSVDLAGVLVTAIVVGVERGEWPSWEMPRMKQLNHLHNERVMRWCSR